MPRPSFDLPDMLRQSKQIRQEFADTSDRGAALAGASYLDIQLQHLFSAYVVELSSKEQKDLFGDGALSTFSGKITLAHALGLIAESEFKMLQHIRKIRNEFAHHVNRSFEASPVRDWCAHLILPDEMIGPPFFPLASRDDSPPPVGAIEIPDRNNARAVFQCAVQNLMGRIGSRMNLAMFNFCKPPAEFADACGPQQALIASATTMLGRIHDLGGPTALESQRVENSIFGLRAETIFAPPSSTLR